MLIWERRCEGNTGERRGVSGTLKPTTMQGQKAGLKESLRVKSQKIKYTKTCLKCKETICRYRIVLISNKTSQN